MFNLYFENLHSIKKEINDNLLFLILEKEKITFIHLFNRINIKIKVFVKFL